jgi:hypothetical protein
VVDQNSDSLNIITREAFARTALATFMFELFVNARSLYDVSFIRHGAREHCQQDAINAVVILGLQKKSL